MPDWAVGVGVGGRDTGASAIFKKLSAAADAFGQHSSSAFKKAETSGHSLFGSLRQFVPAMTIAGVVAFSEKCIEAFDKTQEAAVLTKNVLRTTSQAAGKSFDDIKKSAQALSAQSIFGKTNIMSNVSNPLLSYTGIKGATFDRTQKAILDVTSKMFGTSASGENLKAVTIGFGRLLETGQGLQRFSKFGVTFSRDQQKMIKLAFESGNAEKARAIILAEVEKKAGGAARALAETNKGMELRKINATNGAFAMLGEALAPIKAVLVDTFIKIMPAVLSLFQAITPIIAAAADCFKWLMESIVGVTGAGGELNPIIKYILIGLAMYKGLTIAAMLATTAFSIAVKGLGIASKIITIAQWLWNAALFACPIVWIIAGIVALIAIIYLLVKNWDKVKEAVKGAIDAVKEFLGLESKSNAADIMSDAIQKEIDAKLKESNVHVNIQNEGVKSIVRTSGEVKHLEIKETGKNP